MQNFTSERRAHPRVVHKKIVVLYHGDCSDGFGGAWAAWRKFGKRAEYIPLFREEPLPKGLVNKTLYFIDFTPNDPKEVSKLLSRNKQVTAIDHHISAKERVLMTTNPLFALNHSGATLAWSYFHSRKKIPWLLRFVEDSDIWTWMLKASEEINEAIRLRPRDFKIWNQMAKELDNQTGRGEYATSGKIILRHRDQMIASLIGGATEVIFLGYKVFALNAPHFFASEGGHILATKHPPFAIVWAEEGESIHVSLRSNGRVDVSKVAQKYGGGGHKNAAGFFFPASKKFPWKLIN